LHGATVSGHTGVTATTGASVHAAGCAQCHGGDLAGTERGPSLLDPVCGPEQFTDVAFADAIRPG